MTPIDSLTAHLSVLKGLAPLSNDIATERIEKAKKALEELKKPYYVGRVVLMDPTLVNRAIHDWYAIVRYKGESYKASGGTPKEALVNLAENIKYA